MQVAKTRTIAIDEAVFEQLRQMAKARNQDVNEYATAFVSQNIRREIERAAQSAQARADLEGPFVPFDPDAIRKRYMEKYGMPDLSHLSKEELAEDTEQIIREMDTETRLQMEREGLL